MDEIKPLEEFRGDVKFGDHVRIELVSGKHYVGYSWGDSIGLANRGYMSGHLCAADIILCEDAFSPMRDIKKEKLTGLKLEEKTLDGVSVRGYTIISRARAIVDR